jgi:hypothetical protein
MIQWRNLNYDPIRYWDAMNQVVEHGTPIGMKEALQTLRNEFPELRYGYFNPPKEKWLSPHEDLWK